MNPLEIISEIYRLLSSCEEQDFAAAEKLETSRETRTVLRTLRRTKHVLAKRVESALAQPLERRGEKAVLRSSQAGTIQRQNAGDRSDWASSISLIASAAAVSVEQLARLLRRSGIEVEARKKETRLSLLRRAELTSLKLPENERKAALDTVSAMLSRSETEGWMDVIHSNKRQ